MKTSLIQLCFYFLILLSHNMILGQNMIIDSSGKSQNLIPQGWTVETQEENGIYFWGARQSNDDQAPGIMQIIFPDAAYSPCDLTLAVLGENLSDIAFLEEQEISNNEAHYILEGKSQNGTVKLAVCVIRDPGQYLFLNVFSALPQEYSDLGSSNLLYKAIQRPNPYNSSQSSVPRQNQNQSTQLTHDYPTNLNMQDVQVKIQMIQNSASFSAKNLFGKWMQVVDYATGNDVQNVVTGEITFGSSGQGHLLHLQSNGKYELTYLYNSVNGNCINKAEINELGQWSLSGYQLSLKASRYSGIMIVCGTKYQENNTNPPMRVFNVGTDPSYQFMTLYGKPFEYSISTEMDGNGNPYILEGFSRTE